MITNDNYYSPNNKGLSQSKIKSFLMCPNYFYRRHILGEVDTKSDAFTVGGAVDDLLTDLTNLNKNNYCVVSRRNLKNPPIGVIEVLQSQYESIVAVADAVEKTSAWQFIKKNFVFQEIIQVPADLGIYFDCYLGKPDGYYIDEKGHCMIVDLKTAITVDARRYYYNAQSYGYFQQMWFYSFILKQKYPQIKSFSFWHLAVEKKEPFTVKLFNIPENYVNNNSLYMLDAINRIKTEIDFKKKDATFDHPTILTDPKDDTEYEEEE